MDYRRRLITVFNTTADNSVRDKIALIFSDLKDQSIVPVLINKIEEIKHSRHISTLIYACAEYDCSEWIGFFVSLVIDLDDSSYLEAISVIEEMKGPISISDKVICVKRLTDYLSSMGKGDPKYEDVENVLEVVESIGPE